MILQARKKINGTKQRNQGKLDGTKTSLTSVSV